MIKTGRKCLVVGTAYYRTGDPRYKPEAGEKVSMASAGFYVTREFDLPAGTKLDHPHNNSRPHGLFFIYKQDFACYALWETLGCQP